jgi:hypothetical protein
MRESDSPQAPLIKAIGSNQEAVRLAGIRVGWLCRCRLCDPAARGAGDCSGPDDSAYDFRHGPNRDAGHQNYVVGRLEPPRSLLTIEWAFGNALDRSFRCCWSCRLSCRQCRCLRFPASISAEPSVFPHGARMVLGWLGVAATHLADSSRDATCPTKLLPGTANMAALDRKT